MKRFVAASQAEDSSSIPPINASASQLPSLLLLAPASTNIKGLGGACQTLLSPLSLFVFASQDSDLTTKLGHLMTTAQCIGECSECRAIVGSVATGSPPLGRGPTFYRRIVVESEIHPFVKGDQFKCYESMYGI